MTNDLTTCTYSLVKARVEASLRENQATRDTMLNIGTELFTAYNHFKECGFKPHEAEMALHHITREILAEAWFNDPGRNNPA